MAAPWRVRRFKVASGGPMASHGGLLVALGRSRRVKAALGGSRLSKVGQGGPCHVKAIQGGQSGPRRPMAALGSPLADLGG